MPGKSLAEQFELKVGAAIPGLLIRSFEHEDAIEEMRQVCCDPNNQWNLATFDLDEGMMIFQEHERQWIKVPGWFEETTNAQGSKIYAFKSERQHNPAEVIKGIPGLSWGKKINVGGQDHTPSSVLVMKNHQRWLNEPGLVQLVANRLWKYKQIGCHIVFLSPTTELPLELRKLFESGHIKHPLPDRQQILEVIESVANPEDLPKDVEPVIDACCGLTRMGVEDAISLSMREHDRVDAKVVFDLKAEAFENSSGALRLYRGNLTLDDYGGAYFLKEFCLDLLNVREANPKFRPKGVFLCGPGGVGKTHFAKCIGSVVGRTTAIGRLAKVKSKWQGEASTNLDMMFETLKAMSPCLALFDEVEGQVSGGKDTGATDGGVKAETNSELLSFMDNREDKDVFIIASCNDIRPIVRDMPEFTRLGRFDALFFLDYPGRKAKDEIWKIHLADYELIDPAEDRNEAFERFKRDHGLPEDEQWTGAEIEACCALARKRRHRGVTVKSVGATLGTIASRDIGSVEAVREWAEANKCYAAEYEGLYRRAEHEGHLEELSQEQPRRRVVKKVVKRLPQGDN
jgi:SpoVK/Ycf46/Vps4 family AAA+-type ATPase